MKKEITFSGNYSWDPTRDSMAFEVTVDNKRGRCLISREALEDHYGADKTSNFEDCFKKNIISIQNAARNIIDNNNDAKVVEYFLYSGSF